MSPARARHTYKLQASIGDLEKYDFVVENLEIVSRSICRCRIVEQLYLDRHTSAAKDELELTLVKLYGAILLYLSKAKSFLERKKSRTCPKVLKYQPLVDIRCCSDNIKCISKQARIPSASRQHHK